MRARSHWSTPPRRLTLPGPSSTNSTARTRRRRKLQRHNQATAQQHHAKLLSSNQRVDRSGICHLDQRTATGETSSSADPNTSSNNSAGGGSRRIANEQGRSDLQRCVPGPEGWYREVRERSGEAERRVQDHQRRAHGTAETSAKARGRD